MIHGVFSGVTKNMINGAATISWQSMLANMLDAPIAELPVCDNVNACQNLVDTGTLRNGISNAHREGSHRAYLVFLQAILEDVLNDETAGLSKCNFMPHASKGFVDVLHDLRWRVAPSQFEKLLPDVTSVAVNHRLRK